MVAYQQDNWMQFFAMTININKHVTPRRGTQEGGECGEFPCPDVGVFRCLSFVAERLYSVVARDAARVVSARQYKQR